MLEARHGLTFVVLHRMYVAAQTSNWVTETPTTRVPQLRKKHGFSQEDMLSFGFSTRHWQQVEAGRPITVTTLLRICEVFELLSCCFDSVEVSPFLSIHQTLIILTWELRINREPHNLTSIRTLSGKFDCENDQCVGGVWHSRRVVYHIRSRFTGFGCRMDRQQRKSLAVWRERL